MLTTFPRLLPGPGHQACGISSPPPLFTSFLGLPSIKAGQNTFSANGKALWDMGICYIITDSPTYCNPAHSQTLSSKLALVGLLWCWVQTLKTSFLGLPWAAKGPVPSLANRGHQRAAAIPHSPPEPISFGNRGPSAPRSLPPPCTRLPQPSPPGCRTLVNPGQAL
jgi:hypothetical protein